MASSTICKLLLLTAIYGANIDALSLPSEIHAQPASNVALRGTTTQSSLKPLLGSERNVNDDSLANKFLRSQCSSTVKEDGPWWMVDLNKPHKVMSVAVTNRVLHCCREQILGAEIRIGNDPSKGGTSNPRCGVISSIESGETHSFSCQGMTGRYVTITIPGLTEQLNLCDVQVFGFPTSSEDEATVPEVSKTPKGAVNVALKGVAQQSSLYNLYGEAKNAIDGSLDSNYLHIHCSSTAEQENPWWRVNLMGEYKVYTVAVTSRGDCCAEGIKGAQIRIGNSAEEGGTKNPICGIISSMEGGETLAFECDGMVGQYVTILLPGENQKLTICEVQVFGVLSDDSGLRGKSLVFPEEGVQDYAILRPSAPIDLTAFTLCLRVSTELTGQREVILFSYFTNRDELNVWREADGRLSLYLGSSDNGVKFSFPGLSTFGTHICVTWESSSGLTNFWVNGKSSVSKVYQRGHRVIPGGTVILGQDQDALGSGFEAKQSLLGEISDVYLWNYVLPSTSIKKVYEGNSKEMFSGNIINWESTKFNLLGNVIITVIE